MKNSINTFKLVRNAQCKQQANAQSQMQSASECNHSVGNLFRALEPNVVCGQYATVVQQCHETAMYSNTVPWPMRFGQWPHDNKSYHLANNIHSQRSRKSFNGSNTGCTCAINDSRTQCKSAKLLHSLFQSRLYINAIHRHLGTMPSVREAMVGSTMSRNAENSGNDGGLSLLLPAAITRG